MDDPRPFGLVHGRIYAGVGDSADAGRAPDRIGVNGTATFSANVESVVTKTAGVKGITLPTKIIAPIVNGALQWQGTDDVPLVANMDAAGVRQGWQWTVGFTVAYIDPNTSGTVKLNLTGWNLDVKPWDGTDATITDLTDQAPVVPINSGALAKGDPGATIDLTMGSITTTTDPDAVSAAIVATSDPLKKKLDLVIPVGPGGGGSGTVTKVAGKSPDLNGAITLVASDVGAATPNDVATVATTASNAADAADDALVAAQAAVNALLGKADKDSPAFGGNPTRTTVLPTTDSSQSLASTAFVQALVAALKALLVNVGVVVYDDVNDVWPSRPPAKIVVCISTQDATAPRPPWMTSGQSIGDILIQHPDSVVS